MFRNGVHAKIGSPAGDLYQRRVATGKKRGPQSPTTLPGSYPQTAVFWSTFSQNACPVRVTGFAQASLRRGIQARSSRPALHLTTVTICQPRADPGPQRRQEPVLGNATVPEIVKRPRAPARFATSNCVSSFLRRLPKQHSSHSSLCVACGRSSRVVRDLFPDCPSPFSSSLIVADRIVTLLSSPAPGQTHTLHRNMHSPSRSSTCNARHHASDT